MTWNRREVLPACLATPRQNLGDAGGQADPLKDLDFYSSLLSSGSRGSTTTKTDIATGANKWLGGGGDVGKEESREREGGEVPVGGNCEDATGKDQYSSVPSSMDIPRNLVFCPHSDPMLGEAEGDEAAKRNFGSLRDNSNSGSFHPCEITKLVEKARDITAAESLVSRYFKYLQGHPKYLSLCLLHVTIWVPRLGRGERFFGKLPFRPRKRFADDAKSAKKQQVQQQSAGGWSEKMLTQTGIGGNGAGVLPTSSSSFSQYPHGNAEPPESEFWTGWPIVQRLQKELLNCLRQAPSSFDGSDLARTLQCLARARARELASYRLVTRTSISSACFFSVHELTEMLRGLVRGLELNGDENRGIYITTYDTEFLEWVLQNMKAMRPTNFQLLSASQLCGIIKSLSRFGHKDSDVIKLIGTEILRRQKEFTDLEWSTCVRAFTQFGVPLNQDCSTLQRSSDRRDWKRLPPPKKPKPMSLC